MRTGVDKNERSGRSEDELVHQHGRDHATELADGDDGGSPESSHRVVLLLFNSLIDEKRRNN